MEIIYCFFATVFFAKVMNAPKKSILFSSIIASVGYLVYIIFVRLNQEIAGFFLGTFIIALSGEICARIIKMPAIIFIFPAVVPIVPGLGLYNMMVEFVQNDIYSALMIGVETLMKIGAMAIAMAFSSLIMSKAPNLINSKSKNNK